MLNTISKTVVMSEAEPLRGTHLLLIKQKVNGNLAPKINIY